MSSSYFVNIRLPVKIITYEEADGFTSHVEVEGHYILGTACYETAKTAQKMAEKKLGEWAAARRKEVGRV